MIFLIYKFYKLKKMSLIIDIISNYILLDLYHLIIKIFFFKLILHKLFGNFI
jgi:hypothetical protein